MMGNWIPRGSLDKDDECDLFFLRWPRWPT